MNGREITGLQQAESSWRLKEFMEGVVTTGVGSLFQYFMPRVEKGNFLRRRRLGTCRPSK